MSRALSTTKIQSNNRAKMTLWKKKKKKEETIFKVILQNKTKLKLIEKINLNFIKKKI